METREDPAAEAAGTVEIVKEPGVPGPGPNGDPGADDTAIQIPGELSLLPLKEHVLFPAVVAPSDDWSRGSSKGTSVCSPRPPRSRNSTGSPPARTTCAPATRVGRPPSGQRSAAPYGWAGSTEIGRASCRERVEIAVGGGAG